MKHKKKYENKIVEKSRNTAPIRVLYKKTGQPPETKIIDNVFKLKKGYCKKETWYYSLWKTLYYLQQQKSNT